MTFRFTVSPASIDVEFTAGSIAEAEANVFDDPKETESLTRIFAKWKAVVINAGFDPHSPMSEVSTEPGTSVQVEPEPVKRRGRRSVAQIAADEAKAAQEAGTVTAQTTNPPVPTPAPSNVIPLVQPPAPVAIAPAPIPVPATGTDGLEIPGLLDANKRTNAPVPTPVPAATNATPAPTLPPPPTQALILGPKIVEAIKTAAPTEEAQNQYVDWLVKNQIIVASGSFAQAMDVLRFTPDAKLAGIATALGVS